MKESERAIMLGGNNIMKYFETYSSNTYAGSGNQYFFRTNDNEIHTGRIFYKIAVGGCYHYSFLFSNIIDSTFADGSVSHKNLICDSWTITGARVGICDECDMNALETFAKQNGAGTEEPVQVTMVDGVETSDCDNGIIAVTAFTELTFQGSKTKEVMPGEFFTSDPVLLAPKAGTYLCLELSFQGSMIPYLEERLIPAFLKKGDKWVQSQYMPFAGMVGCDREVKRKIGYLGDSITQGIGTEINSYAHWNAKVSEKLGSDYAYWNLGLGYGRANDMASDSAWLFKAKQNDLIVVCCGVNDIMHGQPEAQIKRDLNAIIDTLRAAGKKILLQTVPPFDYEGSDIEKWKNINQYIKETLSEKVDVVFDVVPILRLDEEHSHAAKFGGHPNAAGCQVWADALYPVMQKWIEQNR